MLTAQEVAEESSFVIDELQTRLSDMTRDRDEWRQQHQNAMSCWKTDVANVVESANFQAMAKLCDELEDKEREFEMVCNQRDEVTEKWHALRESLGAVPDTLRALEHALSVGHHEAAHVLVKRLLVGE